MFVQLRGRVKVKDVSVLKVAKKMKFRNRSVTMLFATIMTIDVFFLQIVIKAINFTFAGLIMRY